MTVESKRSSGSEDRGLRAPFLLAGPKVPPRWLAGASSGAAGPAPLARRGFQRGRRPRPAGSQGLRLKYNDKYLCICVYYETLLLSQ
jgi:hypothetical protein